MRKWNVNENYFDKIDSNNKAYLLGLWYSDGYTICKQKGEYIGAGITLRSGKSEVELLTKINKIIGYNKPLIFGTHTSTHSTNNYCRLLINRKHFAESLAKLGVVKCKTFKIHFPTFLNEKYIPHFIRGYFDGDGCIWEGKAYFKKFPSRPNGRKIHNVKFNITGYTNFILELQDYLVDKLGFRKTKVGTYEFRTDKPVITLEYSGRNNLRKFYNFIYRDADLYLRRKKEKFEEICAFNEKSLNETGLIAGTPEMVISSQALYNNEGSSTIPEMEVESSDSKCPALNK